MSIGGWILFSRVSIVYLLLPLLLVKIQLISFSMLAGQMFPSLSVGFICLNVLWIVINVLHWQCLLLVRSLQLLLCLHPFYSLLHLLRYFFLHERAIIDIRFTDPLYQWTLTLRQILSVVTLSIVLHWILIWYLEKLYPGDYGIALRWNFPLSMDYWRGSDVRRLPLTRETSDESVHSSVSDDSEDEEGREADPIVQIRSLVKSFAETRRIVLDHISLNLYENQITALLGQNGAGWCSSSSSCSFLSACSSFVR